MSVSKIDLQKGITYEEIQINLRTGDVCMGPIPVKAKTMTFGGYIFEKKVFPTGEKGCYETTINFSKKCEKGHDSYPTEFYMQDGRIYVRFQTFTAPLFTKKQLQKESREQYLKLASFLEVCEVKNE